jgi:hypothetical protein
MVGNTQIDMTVYLLSCVRPIDDQPTSFFDLWVRTMIGPVLHIELVFIQGESVYGFWITFKTEVALFQIKTMSTIRKVLTLEWFKVNVTREEEDKLVFYCNKTANTAYFSSIHYYMAGFPIQNEWLASFFWSRLYKLGDQKTLPDGKTPEFCASLIVKTFQCVLGKLKDYDPYHMSPTDVVLALQKEMQMERIMYDPMEKLFEVTMINEEFGIVRSTHSEELFRTILSHNYHV